MTNKMNKNDNEIVFLYGLPASGKSTFSKYYEKTHENFVRIGADSIRKELYGTEDSYGNPEEIYRSILRRMKETLESGKSFIYDAVNMKRDFRLDFLSELSSYDIPKTIIQLPTSKEVCRERFLLRKRSIPLSSVDQYFCMDEHPTYEEGWTHIYTCCSKAYVASPFFEDAHRDAAKKVASFLRSKCIDTYLPMENKIENAWDYPNHIWGKKVFEADIKAIQEADTVFVLSYGRQSSAGTNWEAGYAFGMGKRVVVVEMPGVDLMSLMVSNGCHAVLKSSSFFDYDFVEMPRLFDETMEQK